MPGGFRHGPQVLAAALHLSSMGMWVHGRWSVFCVLGHIFGFWIELAARLDLEVIQPTGRDVLGALANKPLLRNLMYNRIPFCFIFFVSYTHCLVFLLFTETRSSDPSLYISSTILTRRLQPSFHPTSQAVPSGPGNQPQTHLWGGELWVRKNDESAKKLQKRP